MVKSASIILTVIELCAIFLSYELSKINVSATQFKPFRKKITSNGTSRAVHSMFLSKLIFRTILISLMHGLKCGFI